MIKFTDRQEIAIESFLSNAYSHLPEAEASKMVDAFNYGFGFFLEALSEKITSEHGLMVEVASVTQINEYHNLAGMIGIKVNFAQKHIRSEAYIIPYIPHPDDK